MNNLSGNQKEILRSLENKIYECGVDGGMLTSEAIHNLKNKEIEFGVYDSTVQTPRWQQEDELLFLTDHKLTPSEVEDAFAKLGLKKKSVQYIPFKESILVGVPKRTKVFPIGSIEFVKGVQANQNLECLHFSNFKKYECTYYYEKIGHKYLLQSAGKFPYVFITKEKLVGHYNFYYDFMGKDGKLFIRPNKSDKVFNGEVVSRNMFKEFTKTIKNDNELCVISTPQNIIKEYRLFISKSNGIGKVLTGSSYRINGEIDYKQINFEDDKQLIEYAESVCNLFDEDIYCLDIVIIEQFNKKEFKICEVSSVNCSGLYDMNIELILTEINNYYKDKL
jgi:hypothetical protein